ncbi:MAG: hypothetical protein QXR84_09235 [Candidatus Bathyarchaeia archaeon]
MCTSDLCPPFGVYYGAQQGTEACINGACCAGGGFTCICITCDSDSDCPACSNHVVPRCEDGRCKCRETCENSNSNCITGYCCDNDVNIPPADRGTGNCVANGTIFKNKYLCDPPEWNGETNGSSIKSEKSLFETIVEILRDLLSKGLFLH